MNRFAGFDARDRRRSSSRALVTGTEVTPQQGGASCVVTTDSESPRLQRQNSHVQSIELPIASSTTSPEWSTVLWSR